jgi:hypothetical protein
MKHGVEVYTPWSWQPGMWEVLHLFSRYNGPTSVRAASDDETTVSGYATVNDVTGDIVVVLVNRALTASTATSVNVANKSVPDGVYSTLQLANLPATETFVSHSVNALASGSVAVMSNRFSLTLPPLSVTSVLLTQPKDQPPPTNTGASRLINVSVRAKSRSGANALIVGFVIGGSGTKPLLLRGIGPALGKFGLTSTLANPVMRLVTQAGATISTNDNWGSDAANISTLSAQVGAFGLDTGSLDSAMAATLATGAYTALIEGKSGESGIALGEAYDADLSSPARFVNLSARTWVGTDADSLIAGFVVRGEGRKIVLIRAVGPGLAIFNVPGLLNDPVLRVYRQSETSPFVENDNWGSDLSGTVEAASSKVGAFALSVGSKDAALLVNLPEGNYTAVVTGLNNTTGVALVEVYEVN